MHSKFIDRLFVRIQRLQLSSLLLRLTIFGVSAWLLQDLASLAAEKYALHFSSLILSLPATLLLIPAIIAITRYLAQTQERTAAALDRQHQLKERLVTYVQFRDSNHPFAQALCREIEARIAHLPVGSSRIFAGLLAPTVIFLLLLSAIAVLPYLPVPAAIAARKEERKEIESSVRKLNLSLQEIQKRKPQDPQLTQLTKELRKIAQELEKPETTKVEALKKLNAMQKLVQDQAKREGMDRQKQLRLALQDAMQEGTAAQGNADSKEMQELLDELEGGATGQQDLRDGSETEGFQQQGKWSGDQAQRIKEAFEDYKAQKSESERQLAELQKNLKDARKGITGGTHKYTTDSTLTERDLERRKSGVEDGPGTTNFDVGPQSFDTNKKPGEKYVEDRTKAQYEQLYEGQREKVESEPLYLNSKWNNEDIKYTRIRNFGLESESTVEAAASELTQQNQSESEVRKEKIPAAYRKMVKKYLESIQ